MRDQDIEIRVVDLPTLIEIKSKVGRAKDKLAVADLIAILEERARSGICPPPLSAMRGAPVRHAWHTGRDLGRRSPYESRRNWRSPPHTCGMALDRPRGRVEECRTRNGYLQRPSPFPKTNAKSSRQRCSIALKPPRTASASTIATRLNAELPKPKRVQWACLGKKFVAPF